MEYGKVVCHFILQSFGEGLQSSADKETTEACLVLWNHCYLHSVSVKFFYTGQCPFCLRPQTMHSSTRAFAARVRSQDGLITSPRGSRTRSDAKK